MSESNSVLRHARYVVSENPVTGFALRCSCSSHSPLYSVPTSCRMILLQVTQAATLQPPTIKHWFGTDQLGRDIFSRVVVATKLDFAIAISSVILVFAMGGLAGIASGFFGGGPDRIVGRISDTIMAFPLFRAGDGDCRRPRQHRDEHRARHCGHQFPLYVRVARAEANVRREAGFVQAARLSGNGEFRVLLMHILPNIMPIMMVQVSLTMGYAILNAAGSLLSASACGHPRLNGESWSRKVRATSSQVNGGSLCFPDWR